MEKYQQVFNHFDSNGDGKICSEELRLCLCSMGGEMTAEESAAAAALVDSDGDGLMCLEDFVKIVEGAGEEDKQRDLKAAFELYAPEGGACITPESLKKMLIRLGQTRTVGDCRSMIARFDLNGDGVLDFDEFKIMMSCLLESGLVNIQSRKVRKEGSANQQSREQDQLAFRKLL